MDGAVLSARRARRPSAQRGDPSIWPLGLQVPAHLADDHPGAPRPAVSPPRPRPPHDRRRRRCLYRHPCLALCRRSDVRSLEGGVGDRAAHLSHHRLRRLARPGGARRDLDRCDGPPARRARLEPSPPDRLRHRHPRRDPLFHAAQVGNLRADGDGGIAVLAALLSLCPAPLWRAAAPADLGGPISPSMSVCGQAGWSWPSAWR